MDWYYELFSLLVSFQKVLKENLSDHLRAVADTGQLAPSIVMLAVGLGMIHALTPGHGKAVVVSYFIGKQARPLEGFSLAARVALSHTVSAILLVLLFGQVVSLFGRPSGAASIVQTTSYALIAVIGAYYLYRAIQSSDLHPDHHCRSSASILPYAVGVLPCPLTMLVVGHAIALGAYITGLMLAGLIGVGAALTIGAFGTVGIIARRGLLGRFDPDSRILGLVLTALEIGSSVVILALGVILFIGKLSTL
jgi:ABC-type nickel/cobalt efflux system permease component RcnA